MYSANLPSIQFVLNEVPFYLNMFIPIVLNQIMSNAISSFVVTKMPHMSFIFNSKIIKYNLQLLTKIPYVESHNLTSLID